MQVRAQSVVIGMTSTDKDIWVITSEYNLYDQEGAYFIHAWYGKPSFEEMKKFFNGKYKEEYLQHIYSGGGRTKRYEDQWYNFFKQ